MYLHVSMYICKYVSDLLNGVNNNPLIFDEGRLSFAKIIAYYFTYK